MPSPEIISMRPHAAKKIYGIEQPKASMSSVPEGKSGENKTTISRPKEGTTPITKRAITAECKIRSTSTPKDLMNKVYKPSTPSTTKEGFMNRRVSASGREKGTYPLRKGDITSLVEDGTLLPKEDVSSIAKRDTAALCTTTEFKNRTTSTPKDLMKKVYKPSTPSTTKEGFMNRRVSSRPEKGTYPLRKGDIISLVEDGTLLPKGEVSSISKRDTAALCTTTEFKNRTTATHQELTKTRFKPSTSSVTKEGFMYRRVTASKPEKGTYPMHKGGITSLQERPDRGTYGGITGTSMFEHGATMVLKGYFPSIPNRENACMSRNLGAEGKEISLLTNHFGINLKNGTVYHYAIRISPMTCASMKSKIMEDTMLAYKRIFQTAKPVFDGLKNLYTWEALPMTTHKMELEVMLKLDGRNRSFRVSIQCLGRVNLAALTEFLEGRASFIPHKVLQVLGSALRQLNCKNFISVGNLLYSAPGGYGISINRGLEAWPGYHQTLTLCSGGLTLNVDLTTTVMHKAQSVIEFMQEVLDMPDLIAKNQPLDSKRTAIFRRKIKGLKIETTHDRKDTRTYTVCNVSSQPADSQKTNYWLPSGDIVHASVVDVYLQQYNLMLKHPHLPCLHVAPENMGIYIPVEVCNIVAGQRYGSKITEKQTNAVMKVSLRPAPETEKLINDMIKQSDYNDNPFLKERGISLETNMMAISGRVLPAPALMFSGMAQTEVPKDGEWTYENKQVYEGIRIIDWAIVNFAPQKVISSAILKNFTERLQQVGQESGVPFVTEPICKSARIDEVETVFRNLKASRPKLQLVLVLLHGKSSIYREIKHVGDICTGVITQCLQTRNVIRIKPDVLVSLCLKINTKIGGYNSVLLPTSRPLLLNEPVVIMGSDVCHPSTRNPGIRSVAAVVGSTDLYPSRYAASVRIQNARLETIIDLQNMIKDCLMKFYIATHYKPVKMFFYRDGVAEHQFKTVLNKEVKAIRKACSTLQDDYMPGLTYLVVQKRHHTRIFCENKEETVGQWQNIPPGTTVDKSIISLNTTNFFQCSHVGSQGTTRPSHYHVLVDDNNTTLDELEQLTYYLCYTSGRSTTSNSKPAPVVYAHLAASRGYAHLTEAERRMREDNKGSVTNEDLAKSVSIHPDLLQNMYFI